MKTLYRSLKLFIVIALINSAVFAQLKLTAYTDKDVYNYGETIYLYCKVTNTADTTFEFFAPTYQSCQAEFSFNDFKSWEYTGCLATTELLTFKPHASKIYSWKIEPRSLALPNKEGTQTIIGKYYFDLADTIYIQAPKFVGGEIRVAFNGSDIDSINSIRNQLNAYVIFGDHFGEVKGEVWQIEGFDIDSLIQIYSNDSIFIYFEKSVGIGYETIVDENPLDYYPLQVGNKWYYSEVGITYDVEPRPIDESYKVEITKDTLINDKHFFYVEGHPNDKRYWVRIDSVEGKIYKSFYAGQEERLLYDLMYECDDSTITDDGIILSIENSDTLLWDKNRVMRTYNYLSLYTQNILFVQMIGIVHKFNSFDFGYTNVSLKGCVLNGIVYGDTTLVGVNDRLEYQIPTQFSLSQNYPNPFNPTTTIGYTVPSSSVMLNSFQHLNDSEIPNQVRDDNYNVSLIIYDILGRIVKILVNHQQNPGKYSVQFNAENLSSGIYYYQLRTGNLSETKKMILLR